MWNLKLEDKAIGEFKFVVELAAQRAAKGALSSSGHKLCPRCGSAAFHLRSLDRYYCFNCKSYVT
ncbi:hypothetical protein [Infirmifilum sp.]|uniref:hypothetical protein n=1 Tax=Infirmifilum sp. TaxID=2856575 RepID=UPI003D0F811E